MPCITSPIYFIKLHDNIIYKNQKSKLKAINAGYSVTLKKRQKKRERYRNYKIRKYNQSEMSERLEKRLKKGSGGDLTYYSCALNPRVAKSPYILLMRGLYPKEGFLILLSAAQHSLGRYQLHCRYFFSGILYLVLRSVTAR